MSKEMARYLLERGDTAASVWALLYMGEQLERIADSLERPPAESRSEFDPSQAASGG